VLAELWGCGFVDLVQTPPEMSAAGMFDPEQMALEGWIPLELRGGVLHVATAEPPTRELRRHIHSSCAPSDAQDIIAMTFSATTDWDVLAAIRMLFAHELRHDAAYGLSERDPLRSALGGPSRGQRIGLGLAAAGIIAAGVLGILFSYAQTYFTGWTGERMLADLRNNLFRHLQRLSLGFYERNRAGVIISRLTNDVEALDQLVTDGVSSLVQNTLTLVGTAVLLFFLDVPLAAITIASLVPLYLLFRWFTSRAAAAFRRTRETAALM
jgi:ABC-type multidrug transport system fused ATPase/permease subunit